MIFPTDSELTRLRSRLYAKTNLRTPLSADSIFVSRDVLKRLVDTADFAKERYNETRVRQLQMIRSAAGREGGLARAANMGNTNAS